MSQSSRLEHSTSAAAWRAVWSVAAATFLLVTTEYLPVGLLSDIASAMRVSEGVAGLAVTVPGIVAALAAPATLLGASKLDRRVLMWVLTAAIIASNALAAIAPSFVVFLAARLLLGIGVGGVWAVGIAAGRRLVAEAHGGKATAIISAGIGAGTVVGVPAGAYLGHLFGWRYAFAATAVFGLMVLVSQIALLPRLPAGAPTRLSQFSALLTVHRARVGLIGITLLVAGHFLAYTFLEPFLTQTAQLKNDALSIVLLVLAVGGLLGGFVAERLARSGYVRAQLVMCAIQAAGIASVCLASGSFSLTLVCVFAWGIAFGGIPVVSQIWIFQAAPRAYESGAALMVTFLQIGLASGALFGGALVDSAGVTHTFYVAVAVTLISTLVFAWVTLDSTAGATAIQQP